MRFRRIGALGRAGLDRVKAVRADRTPVLRVFLLPPLDLEPVDGVGALHPEALTELAADGLEDSLAILFVFEVAPIRQARQLHGGRLGQDVG
jgi:hypothetical protein